MSIVAYGFGIDGTIGGVSRVVRNASIELNQMAPSITVEPRGLDLQLSPANNLILLSNDNIAFLEESDRITASVRQFEIVVTNRSIT